MALEMTVTKDSITSDCGTLTIKDTTGNYDVDLNPTGYGSPNEVRSNLYILLFVVLKRSTGDVLISVGTYNPNTVSQWEVSINEDGWYEITMFACLRFPEIVFNTGMVTYYNNKFWKAIADGAQVEAPAEGDFWTEVKLPEDVIVAIDLEQENIYLAQDNFIEQCNGRKCASKKFIKSGCGCNSDSEYDVIKHKIEAVEIHEAQTTYAKGQKIVETIQKLCSDSTC